MGFLLLAYIAIPIVASFWSSLWVQYIFSKQGDPDIINFSVKT